MSEIEIGITVESVIRLTNSRNGIGTWQVNGTIIGANQKFRANTKTDTMFALSLTGNERGDYRVTLNGRDRITNMVKINS